MTQDNGENEIDQNWFDQYLHQYDYDQPKRGQILEGEILRINEDALVVGIGQKRDAIVPSRDLSRLDKKILENLSVGDHVMVSVLYIPAGDKDLLVSLSQGMEYESWKRAEKLLANGTVIELEVIGQNKGGLLVEFESMRGFVPASQIPDLRQVHDRLRAQQIKQEMIGSRLALKAIEVDRQRRRLVFSALAAQESQRKKRLMDLEKGQIFINAKVASVVNFGVFVDLEGVDGLVHLSELDWHRVRHPSDHFKSGDEIDVQILDVDVDKERVSLSRKALLPNPWDAFRERHPSGEIISGKVTRVLDFGAFVELDEGIVGLVHASEVGYSASGEPQDVVMVGESVLVRILEIDAERERVSLSMRRVPREKQIAWLTEELEGALDAPEEDTEDLEGELDVPEEDTEDLESELDAPEEVAEDLEGELDVPEEDTEDLKGELDVPKEDTEDLEAELDVPEEDTEDLEAELDTPEEDAEDLEGELDALEEDTEDLESELDTPEEDTEDLEGELDTSEEDTEDFEGELDVQEEVAEDLEGELDAPEEDTEDLEVELDVPEKDAEDLEGELDVPEVDTEGLEDELVTPEEDTEDLEGELDALEKDTEDFE